MRGHHAQSFDRRRRFTASSGSFALIALIIVVTAASAHAADPLPERPRWSLEVKGGRYYPTLENWSQPYGRKYVNEYSGTLAYKISRQFEAGLGAGAARASGKAFAQQHSISSGEVTLSGEVTQELFPAHVFVLARGVITETQWLVPYVGGGFTRIYYRQKAQGQETVRGKADGYHARAGIQLSLDGVDRHAANSMYLDYGVQHTYLFLEAEYIKAKVGSPTVDLGGIAYSAGLLFEF